MTFRLTIRFAGMCLFVPTADNSRLYVLMPPVHPHHGSHGRVEQHLTRLLYNPGYEERGGQSSKEPRVHEMEHRELDFPELSTADELRPNMAEKDIVNLTTETGGRVARHLLQDSDTAGTVLSRVALGAGSIGPHNPGAPWRLHKGDPDRRHMAIWAEWQIPNVQGDHLDLRIRGMNQTEVVATQRLYPIGNAINLYLYHTPDVELPREVPPKDPGLQAPDQDPVEHFRHYYPLVGNPAQQPLPHDNELGVHPPKEIAGSRVTCIMAEAEAE